MNILLIHQYFLEKNDGGGSRFNEMTRRWSQQGHEMSVLAGMVHYNTGKKIDRYKGRYFYMDLDFYPKVDVVRSHVSESYNTNFLGRLWGYFSFVFSSLYAGIFKLRKKHDVILVTSPPLFVGITAYLLSKWYRIPFVFEVRDLWPESAVDTGVLKNKMIIKLAYKFEAFMYRKAAVINVLTPAFKTKLVEKGVPADKITFIPNAADFTLAEELQTSFNTDEFRKQLGFTNKFIITYVGAHGVANHLIQLLQAAERLKDTNVIFQLIGTGMQKEMLVDYAEKHNLKNVVFRDPVPKTEVFKYILASDMGASVLKKVDTFKTIYSNKTFDYMSCKKPVFLLIDGVSRELVETAGCGIYAEPENIDQIVAAARKMRDHQNELDQMGLRGYEYARKHFDRNKLADNYTLELKKIITSVS
ncbi:glycosyltransferase WbuB [Nonlabens spongiae]|uniref:Glycosyltransferase WbuB n=1 Tax=Nonlabens spongiae TaxID=331648 RepID=A0A1W6MJH4_9FLAO|nr:glycosyltransferase family 4 protein [Nonlabens spongiae]ARN77765.1 glycosyltransferase WbuB [Nonlabens spongiae]